MKIMIFLTIIIFIQVHFELKFQNELNSIYFIDNFSFLTAASSLYSNRKGSNSRQIAGRVGEYRGLNSEFKRLCSIDINEQESTECTREALFEDVSCEKLGELLLEVNEEFEELEHNTEPLMSLKVISVCLAQLKEIEGQSDPVGMASYKQFNRLMQSVNAVNKANENFLKFIFKLETRMSFASSLISELGILLLKCIENILLESTKLSEIYQFIKDLKLLNRMIMNITRHVQSVFNKYCQERSLRTLEESILGLKSQLSKKQRTKSQSSTYSSVTSTSTSTPRSRPTKTKAYMAQTLSSKTKGREKYSK
ncbi:Uncharacterized protein CTYZ_00002131 [Cryptosporidium tyzzeri]|nr:Uncharacterized protein CTYZ_00002131 [Cryptosporidium tyzzeri]